MNDMLKIADEADLIVNGYAVTMRRIKLSSKENTCFQKHW